MTTSNIKSIFNIMAHFDTFSYAAKDKFESHVMQKVDMFSVAELSDIAFSLTRLRTPNQTLLAMIQRKIVDQ